MTLPHRYNAIWLSDIHLGTRDCKADFLLSFLRATHADTLYLVGDIVDVWSLRRSMYWPAEHHEVLRTLLEKSRSGTRVVYIPGNHDEACREFIGGNLMGVEIVERAEHTTGRGKRMLVQHGDEFDCLVRCGPARRWLGTRFYDLLLLLNRHSHRVRRWCGLPYWSLAHHIKNKVSGARAAIAAFEEVAIAEARREGFDGIICGHIHQPDIRSDDDILYCNDGDWVESCTALVEDRSGWLELLHWGDVQQPVYSEQAANDDRISRVYALPLLEELTPTSRSRLQPRKS